MEAARSATGHDATDVLGVMLDADPDGEFWHAMENATGYGPEADWETSVVLPDIVHSAGVWDNPEAGWAVWEFILEPRGVTAITTPCGAIVFDETEIQYIGEFDD